MVSLFDFFGSLYTLLKREIFNMDRLFKTIKENYQMVITIVTATLTILYAYICYCVYIYNLGCSRALNIDMHLMKINYIEYIYLLCLVLPYLIFFFLITNWMYHNFNSKSNLIIKSISFLLIFFSTFLIFIYSFKLLIQHEIDLKLILFLLLIYSTIEFFLLFAFYNSNHIKINTLKKLQSKIFALSIVLLPMIPSMIYDDGFNSYQKKNVFVITSNDHDKIATYNYAIVYCNGTQYILCPYELNNNILTIDTSTHKVVNVESIDTKTIHPSSVELKP